MTRMQNMFAETNALLSEIEAGFGAFKVKGQYLQGVETDPHDIIGVELFMSGLNENIRSNMDEADFASTLKERLARAEDKEAFVRSHWDRLAFYDSANREQYEKAANTCISYLRNAANLEQAMDIITQRYAEQTHKCLKAISDDNATFLNTTQKHTASFAQVIMGVVFSGGEAVRIIEVSFPSGLTAGNSADIIVECSGAGRLELQMSGDGTEWRTIADIRAAAGRNTIHWDGFFGEAVPAGGRYALKVTGFSEDGVEGTARQISFALAAPPTPQPTLAPTPSPTPYIPSQADSVAGEGLSYWSLPIGNLEDTKAIWDVMMQPIIVINGPQKETYKLRATPSKTGGRANIVGEVTYASQGVHVIRDNGDGWTLIETYNSSYGPDCDSRPGYGKTDELITGYVETSLLKEITPWP